MDSPPISDAWCVPLSATPDQRAERIFDHVYAGLALPRIRALAADIVRRAPDPLARAALVLRTAQAAGFRPDEGCDRYGPVDYTLDHGGDCDDLAPLAICLAYAAGLEASLVYMVGPPEAAQDHVSAKIRVGDTWYWAEPSLPEARLGEHPYAAVARIGHGTRVFGGTGELTPAQAGLAPLGTIAATVGAVVVGLLAWGAYAFFTGGPRMNPSAPVRRAPRANPPTASSAMSETWARGVLQEAVDPWWLERSEPWAAREIEADGRRLRLEARRRANPHGGSARVVWAVRPLDAADDELPLAAGTAYQYEESDALMIGSSALAPEARRRGIYPQVLRALRDINGAPIESDESMTAGAIRAWEKVGAVDAERHSELSGRVGPVMRINPRAPRENPPKASPPSRDVERWSEAVLGETLESGWGEDPLWATRELEVGGRTLTLRVFRREYPRGGAAVTWDLRDPRDSVHAYPVAAGDAGEWADRPGVLQINNSAVEKSARRAGVYPAVLRALREINRGPIESGGSLSAGAIRAWEKLGAVDVERDGGEAMRINPSRAWRRADLESFRHHGSAAIVAERAGDVAAAIKHHEAAAGFAAAKPKLAAYHAAQAARLRGAPRANPMDAEYRGGGGAYRGGGALERAMADGVRFPLNGYFAAKQAEESGARVVVVMDGGGLWDVQITAPADAPIRTRDGLRYRTLPDATIDTLRAAGFEGPLLVPGNREDDGTTYAAWMLTSDD